MIWRVKIFGPAARILGGAQLEIAASEERISCGQLKELIERQHPELAALMTSARLAVNCAYVDDHLRLSGDEEIALIQAVSGG